MVSVSLVSVHRVTLTIARELCRGADRTHDLCCDGVGVCSIEELTGVVLAVKDAGDTTFPLMSALSQAIRSETFELRAPAANAVERLHTSAGIRLVTFKV
jgi:hypothetical protein